MAAFAINPPSKYIVADDGRTVSSEWYRWFSRVQGVVGDDVVAQLQASPVLSYSTSSAFTNSKVLTAGAGMSFTSAATTLTIALAASGVTAATYGSASQVSQITVDQYGRATLVANVTITPAAIGAVPTTTTVTAGAGLTGGGDLSANRTFDVGAGTGITVNANDVALDTSSTRNTDHASVTLTAGAGLTGGGDISANRSFAVGAGTGITVNADDVALTVPTAAGTYSPTLDNTTNLDSAPTLTGPSNYMQVGSIVTVSGMANVDPTASGALSGFNVELPVASNIGAFEDCTGTASCGALQQSGFVIGDAANNNARVVFFSTTTVAQDMCWHFSYQVI